MDQDLMCEELRQLAIQATTDGEDALSACLWVLIGAIKAKQTPELAGWMGQFARAALKHIDDHKN